MPKKGAYIVLSLVGSGLGLLGGLVQSLVLVDGCLVSFSSVLLLGLGCLVLCTSAFMFSPASRSVD